MKWLWVNGTQVVFGAGAVREHIAKFVPPKSKVLCTFGGGSIDRNGARADTQAALDGLECEVRWEGNIPANPEFDRLIEIVAVVKEWRPDLLLAVGGGSVLDGTKFIALAAKVDTADDAWRIVTENAFPETAVPLGTVLTLPAAGSEWNLSFVISRRSIRAKFGVDSALVFPKFSLLDPRYAMTIPVRQLRNGVFDAIAHCIDQFLTGQEVPIMDGYWANTIRELVDIGPDVIQPASPIELRERLIVAASFACNGLFRLGKEVCWGIHMIGHQLTVKYGIDHGATLSIAAPDFLESQFELRKPLLAKCAEAVFDVRAGTVDEKARAFIAELRKFIVKMGLPTKVSEWEYEPLVIAPGDVEDVIQMVVASRQNKPFGWRNTVTEDVVRYVVTRIVC